MAGWVAAGDFFVVLDRAGGYGWLGDTWFVDREVVVGGWEKCRIERKRLANRGKGTRLGSRA